MGETLMPAYLWLGAVLFLAIGDWVSVAKNWRTAEYILKPAVMVVILAWLGWQGGFSGWMIWFALGILFSLVGDIALMLPREQFILGLAAFLVAQLAYIIGFNASLPPLNLASLALALMVALPAITIYLRVASGLRASDQPGLILPILAYTVVLSLMTLSALLTLLRNEWQPGPALLVSAGALLFFLSDTILALNKFVAPIKYGRVANMATYHLGQILIVVGVSLYFL
jgi:uncharacterized membrane protein YhhN